MDGACRGAGSFVVSVLRALRRVLLFVAVVRGGCPGRAYGGVVEGVSAGAVDESQAGPFGELG